ncbi:MAG TPA: hypothetical protein VF838_19565 [Trebonia sp.]
MPDPDSAARYREISLRGYDAELAGFLDALRAADMRALLAIRGTIRQVR